MYIEKDLNTILENLNSRKTESKTQRNSLSIWLSSHRSNVRQNFLRKQLNALTVIIFLPFVIGCSDFFLRKSTLKTFEPLFGKTLPIFRDFRPQVNFETLEYIAKFNDLTDLQNQKLSDLQKSNEISFGIPSFLGTIKKRKIYNTFQKNSTPSQFYTLSSRNISQSQLFDQLPCYLKGYFSDNSKENQKRILPNNFSRLEKQKNRENSVLHKQSNTTATLFEKRGSDPFFTPSLFFNKTFSNIFFPNDYPRKNNLILLVPNNLKDASKKRDFFGDLQKKKQWPGNEFLATRQLKKSLYLKNQFFHNRFVFFTNIAQLNTQFRILFFEKNISEQNYQITADSQTSVLSKKLIKSLEQQETQCIEKFLQDLTKKTIPAEVKQFRTMSGYNYPDTCQSHLDLLKLQKKIFNRNFFESVTFPRATLPSQNQIYTLNLVKLPEILIETRKILIKNSNLTKILYKGPSLSLDSEKALDWKSQGKENLRLWCQKYFSPKNPLVPSQDNFFGLFYSPDSRFDGKSPDWSPFAKTSLFSLRYYPDREAWCLVRPPVYSHFSKVNSSFHFVSAPLKVENNFVRGFLVNSLEDNKQKQTTEEDFLPIIELELPDFKAGRAKLERELTHSSILNLGMLGKLDYIICPRTLSENNRITTLFSGRYIKQSSVFTAGNFVTSRILDNWEPLTLNSWLVCTQLSFALVIFQVLKALADNYGRELLGYLLDLVASLGILDDSLKQEIEILMGRRDKGFRVIQETKKTFSDVVGMKKLLPEFSEVVWFLRNAARDFPLSNTLSRGILLTGPPGTGKTLLVQALAGEAQVPIIVLSGSSLIEPGDSGADKLEMVFEEARQLSPCIVFIDEIDTLGYKRNGVIQNPMGSDELLESLTTSVIKKPEKLSVINGNHLSQANYQSSQKLNQQADESRGKSHGADSSLEQLRLLTQLLIELDGVQKRDGVIVIAATNRPEVLDPALLRPGRFDKVLDVGLPSYEKRIEILKFYSEKLGYTNEIAWNYFGERTIGFTAADLATLMNESTIKAILNETTHTIETIEHGIDRLTTSQSEKPNLLMYSKNSLKTAAVTPTGFGKKTLSNFSKNSILRLAYYQAGKILLSHLLETHPPLVVAHLWPRRITMRSLQIATNLQNSIFQFAKLSDIQERLIGCYAGKAAEFLFLEKISNSWRSYSNNFSTLGLDDILFAQQLSYCFVEKWLFYSKKTTFQQHVFLTENLNTREFRETPEKVGRYNSLIQASEIPPISEAIERESSSLISGKRKDNKLFQSQAYYSIPWWQNQVSSEVELIERNFNNWSRLYLSNPEQSERNPEWFPPDEFSHSYSSLKNVKLAAANFRRVKGIKLKTKPVLPRIKRHIPWNEIASLTRDYPVFSSTRQSFNHALKLLNQNRELLDRIAIELLFHEILRQSEVEKILKDFQILKPQAANNAEDFQKTPTQVFFSSKEKIEIVESSWGENSRKPLPHWIHFSKLG